MIGDNGEHDTTIYAQAVKLYPQINFKTWIHSVYFSAAHSNQGKKLESGQLPWATSVDILIDLAELGLVPLPTAQKIGESLVPMMLDKGSSRSTGAVAFPSWLDCRDMTKANAIRQGPFSWNQPYLNLIQRRCQR